MAELTPIEEARVMDHEDVLASMCEAFEMLMASHSALASAEYKSHMEEHEADIAFYSEEYNTFKRVALERMTAESEGE